MARGEKSIESIEVHEDLAFEKPWKQKRKNFNNKEVFEEIEIFEAKPAVQGPSCLELTSAENGYIRITCSDEYTFLVPSKVVDSFKCIDVILHSEVSFKERMENAIRFPDINAEVMETVLRFVFTDHLNKLKAEKYWGFGSPRLVFQFEVAPEQVMALIHAAHFLGVEPLLNVAATMVAHNLKDVPDLASLPTDLAWCIAEQFSAQDLSDAEERPDFVALNLDTASLWEKHCKKLLQEDSLLLVSSGSTNPPSYDTWDFHQGPPPTSWKSLYMGTFLQQLADCQSGGDTQSFMDEVSQKGKYAYCHSVRPMFWEWIVNGDVSFFVKYTSLFKNILKLSLVKLPLGSPSRGGNVPCLILGDLLESLPLLQFLDVSEAGVTAEAAVYLSIALKQHKRIQVLCLAYNQIETHGFTAIALALPSVRTLKFLDVRENGIGAWVSQDIVEKVQESLLEELIYEGNFKFTSKPPQSPVAPSLLPTSIITQDDLPWSGEISKFEISLKVLFMSGLPRNLKHLQLAQCELTDGRTKILASALSCLHSIQKLNLSDNKITSEGATSIFLWLQENETLLELCLSNNKITDSCALLLSSVIRSHTSLEKVSLMRNYSYSEQHLNEVLNAAMERGLALHTASTKNFTLDLRSTDISHLTQGRILRQKILYSYLNLLL